MFQNYRCIIFFFSIIICYFIIIIIPAIEAQTDTTILAELETLTNGDLSSGSIINYVYNLKKPLSPFPSPNNEENVFITVTTCNIPSQKSPNIPPASPLQVYISTKLKNPGPASDGYDNSDKHVSDEGYLSITTTKGNNEILYIGVYAPKLSNDYSYNEHYYFEIGASTKGFVHPVPTEKGLMLDDTDNSNALFRTSYTSTRQPLYETYYVESTTVNGISKSLCAYQKSPNVTYARWEKNGKYQSSILISNLIGNTKYSAAVTEKSDVGFKLFVFENFQTQDKDNCEIVQNLEFCDKVFYSAPKLTNNAIGYDDLAKSYFDNFTLTIDQYPCDDPDSKYSKYSLVRNCNDCKEAYKDWICAIVIPRCANEESIDFGIGRSKSRVGSIEISQPFTELLPCVDLCYNVTRSCPGNLDISFSCPDTKIISSYGNIVPTNSDTNISCNSLGMKFSSKSSVSIRILSPSQRTLIKLVLWLTILIVGI